VRVCGSSEDATAEPCVGIGRTKAAPDRAGESAAMQEAMEGQCPGIPGRSQGASTGQGASSEAGASEAIGIALAASIACGIPISGMAPAG
jgi:hypothetical protein